MLRICREPRSLRALSGRADRGQARMRVLTRPQAEASLSNYGTNDTWYEKEETSQPTKAVDDSNKN